MATHKNPVCWGAMMVVEDSREVGWQGFKIIRGASKGKGVRETLGPVRETYQEALADVHAYQDSQK